MPDDAGLGITIRPLYAGLSVVVVCYNGAVRLPQTLAHLGAQEVPRDVQWEVIFVDNASTDSTADVARRLWPPDHPTPLQVRQEPARGKSNAILRGINEARYDLIVIVDDDNWLAPDYLATAVQIMDAHPEVGACGGRGEAVCESEPPAWFWKYQTDYACGQRRDQETGGYTEGELSGAGFVLRREAWRQLVSHGFRPLLSTGRGGMTFLGAEDVELNLALRLASWRLWFDPRLNFRHWMPATRLQWSSLRRMIRYDRMGYPLLHPYRPSTGGPLSRHWQYRAIRTLLRLAWVSLRRPTLLAGRAGEGDRVVLEWEDALGRLLGTLRLRSNYDRGCLEVARFRAQAESFQKDGA